uniref:RNA-directed DNA polymerase, eukaryota n=1 Tax=Tanacetum cinerariifolium TaxID=118510 RepID=A0A699KHQ1_TANCI|nr:RNA-directed DNA polymerase, eukaryota [Tanacetum cinerariifolium]
MKKRKHHHSMSLIFQILLMLVPCGRSVNPMDGFLIHILQGKHQNWVSVSDLFDSLEFRTTTDLFDLFPTSGLEIIMCSLLWQDSKDQRALMWGLHKQSIPPHVKVLLIRFHNSLMNKNSKATNMHHSYASMVHGDIPSKNTSETLSGVKKTITLSEGELVSIDYSLEFVLVKVKDVGTMINMYRISRSEGFDNLKIHHVGGLWS